MELFRLLCVVHVFLIRDGQILLMKRKNTGHDDGCYGLPSGKLDGGEEMHAAAIREVLEECGVVIAAADLQRLGVMHIKTASGERLDGFFSTERWSGEICNAEPDKCNDLSWFPPDQLPVNTIPFVARAWEAFKSGQWFVSHGWEQH